MTGQRIALLHFTAPPAIGGVEALLAAQAEVLHAHGDEVTVVSGSGKSSRSYRLVTIPELHPDSPAVRGARSSSFPDRCHPLVQAIAVQLTPILSDQDQIWVHNAFSVNLNPFLTAALHRLLQESDGKRWVAFCHDLSAVSRYVHGPDVAALPPAPRIRFVVLSEARRRELAPFLRIPEAQIEVVPPPLDAFTWLDIGEEARAIVRETCLLDRDLSLLVPSKLLPHKRIDLAVKVTAELKRKGLNPLLLVTGAPSPHEPAVSRWVASELTSLAQCLGVEDDFCLVAKSVGRIPEQRTVRDLMSLCDLVFLPSAEEGYGTPINEAITLRVPVVCSDIPAFREAGGSYAAYVNVEEPAGVAEQMIAIAYAPSVVRRHEVMRSMARFRTSILGLAGQGRVSRYAMTPTNPDS